MSFFADKQTRDDLHLSGTYQGIARIFDRTLTAGGKRLLEDMFRQPLNDAERINERSGTIQYFAGLGLAFPLDPEVFAIAENYLSSDQGRGLMQGGAAIFIGKVLEIVTNDPDLKKLDREITAAIETLRAFSAFTGRFPAGTDHPYHTQIRRAKEILAQPKLARLFSRNGARLALSELIRYDHLLRTELHPQMLELLAVIAETDVYLAVADAAVKNGFAFAQALPRNPNRLKITGLYHPAVKNAVANDLLLDEHSNVIFLTGANMAGKSTLMRSLGVCLYLAHMGFPVAAKAMEFAVKDGLFSSINVPDSLEQGYSHFYTEVLRVKQVAEAVAGGRDLLVIFDELFKGTNVKDAYDATLAISEAFAGHRNCFFMISTHIIEVGQALRERHGHFQFAFLPTVMDGVIPRYTYRLAPGITDDRQGMLIIENEGILELINGTVPAAEFKPETGG